MGAPQRLCVRGARGTPLHVQRARAAGDVGRRRAPAPGAQGERRLLSHPPPRRPQRHCVKESGRRLRLVKRYLYITMAAWLPLEANPEVMTKYSQKLGLSQAHEFHDVFGLDDELLMMVPQPCRALLLCYPTNEETRAWKVQEAARIEKEGQPGLSDKVYWMWQTVSNGCGTVGILHAIMNTDVALDDGSMLAKFKAETQTKTPEERGRFLENAEEMATAHEAAATAGDTAAAPDTDLHFCAFVCVDGGLYELDGRKAAPILHGPCDADSFLPSAAALIRESFLPRAQGSINFNVIAFS
mmetsp:Transcript_25493/g.83934  ORF Transcript_25493/g.83934 Transcript_25493/m.83934 type:complete len:299 (+) Transcript_25493:696-1592(+)